MPTQEQIVHRVIASYFKVGGREAYGGVVFNDEGKILLREPANHYDGYHWTYPKGRPDKGETPEEAALRETREETGIEAEIIAPIPGSFAGGTTENKFFLMRPIKDHGDFHWETQSVRWAAPEEAKKLISQSTNGIGRKRDLAVLDAAVETHNQIRKQKPQKGTKGNYNALWREFLHEVWEDGKKKVPNPNWRPGDSEKRKYIQMVWRFRKDRHFSEEVGRQFEKWKESRKNK